MRRRTTLAACALATVTIAGSALATQPAPPDGTPPLAAGVVVAPVALMTNEAPADSLAARVRQALAGSSATTVAAAVDVEGLGEVLRMDAAHPLPPASVQKSFTALAGLLTVAPDTRYTTEVVARTSPTAGRLPGSLWLVAGGDPYLTRTTLRSMARSVRASGITYVTGDLLLDDSRYDQRRRVSGWKSTYVPGESGPLSAFAVDRNAYRRDSAYVGDPALPNAQLFREYLKAEGVVVHGVTKRYRRPADARVVTTRQSGPLKDVLRRVLKKSDNFAAELVLKEVGKVVRGEGSSAAGYAAVVQVLGAQGVAAGSGTDGSGLSAHNRQTPAAQLDLLQVAQESPVAGEAFRRGLPIACRDGTLEKRMCNTPASGRVSAKTGTLPGIRALSGYTTTASGRKVEFSFQLTGARDGLAARNAIDRAVVVLASATE